ncbi:MAG: hypothetical protein GY827_05125 [Cytophagales bacterium]|nr:hypothetical protein [Cytophagales bacterium]
MIIKYYKEIKLKSGRFCQLIKIEKDLIPNYYLVTFPKKNGQPTVDEVTEMLEIGVKKAKEVAKSIVGDEEAFTILYSGYSARREKGWHIHIILLGNRWKQAWLYFVLGGKNLLQALRLRNDDAPKIQN